MLEPNCLQFLSPTMPVSCRGSCGLAASPLRRSFALAPIHPPGYTEEISACPKPRLIVHLVCPGVDIMYVLCNFQATIDIGFLASRAAYLLFHAGGSLVPDDVLFSAYLTRLQFLSSYCTCYNCTYLIRPALYNCTSPSRTVLQR